MIGNSYFRDIMTDNKSIINQVKSEYKRKFKKDSPILIKAPGRINLIGEHTDYNHGFVLPGAIDKSIVFALNANNSKLIQVHSLHDEHINLFLDKQKPSIQLNWGRYFQAMVEEIRERELNLDGVNCCFGGDIPIGSGLSSSAALCSGFLFGLNRLFDWGLPLLELAIIAQAAEHRIGANVGLMDQFVVLHGEKDKVIFLDCRDYSHQFFPLDLKECTLILINSNVKHEIADSAYNDRRRSCENILSVFHQQDPQIRTLRDISHSDLKGFDRESNPDIKRVAFVLEENDRVHQTTRALSQHDFKGVGELMYESHHGLSREYQVSCTELDILVELAKRDKGVLGARMMGGGFGGCTINLISTNKVDSAVSRIKQNYFEKTRIAPASYEVSLEDGVHFLEP